MKGSPPHSDPSSSTRPKSPIPGASEAVDPPLPDADGRAIVRLLGEVAGLGDSDHASRKRALMDGICRLMSADFCLWGLASQFQPGKQPDYAMMLQDGFTPDQLGKLLVALEHPDFAALTVPIATEDAQHHRHATRLRQDMDPDDNFSQSGALPLWRDANIGPVLLSFRPVESEATSVVAIYRTIPTRKQLVDHRGISVHSANGYGKLSHAHFLVNAEASLVGRSRTRDRPDAP